MTRATWFVGLAVTACASTTPPPAVSPSSDAGPAAAPVATVSVPVTPLAAPTVVSEEPPPAVPATPIAAETAENLGLATLRQYYTDLNNRAFEASKYFAAEVKQYITMQNAKPSAIDQYLRDVFPKQFESYEFLFDEGTVQADGPTALKYIERWRAYVVRKREFQMTVAEVRVEFDSTGKIVDFRYGKVLSRETTPELQ